MLPKEVQTESSELLETDGMKGAKRNVRSDTEQSANAWHCEPSSLEDDHLEKWMLTLWDVSLVAIPIALIVKIALCIYCYYNDQDHRGTTIDMTSGMTIVLTQINEQMVTLFTVIFAAIVATLVRRIALYKAERGAYLCQLEQLQGSISLTGTLKMIWFLRAWTSTSLVLCVVWAFYYLGSQAAKREFVLASSADFIDMPGMVANFDGPTGLASIDPNPAGIGTIDDPEFVTTLIPVLNSVFTSSAKDALDNWRGKLIDYFPTDRGSSFGPLIPNIAYALNPFPLKAKQVDTMFQNIVPLDDPEPLGKSSKGGWLDVSRQSGNFYTSFFGRPLVVKDMRYPNLRNQSVSPVDGTYVSQSAYFTVACNQAELLPLFAFPNGTHPESSISFNMTTPGPSSPKDRQNHILQEFELWYRWPQDQNLSCISANSLRSVCNISKTEIDMETSCKSYGCVPRRIRYRDNQPAEDAVSFSTAFENSQFAENFFSNIIDSMSLQTSLASPTDFIRYSGIPLLNPSNYAQQTSDNASCVQNTQIWQASLLDTARYHVSPQLSVLFNTYYNLFRTYNSFEYSNLSTFNKSYKSDGNSDLVTFHGNFDEQGYYIHWEWIAIDFVSCLFLLTAGIACYWLRMRTLAPDIFGFVSSLTRDNSHLGLPDSGSSLSGLERTRLLRDVKIKIGDLHSGDRSAEADTFDGSEVGRIGLVRADTDSERARPLQRGKLYI